MKFNPTTIKEVKDSCRDSIMDGYSGDIWETQFVVKLADDRVVAGFPHYTGKLGVFFQPPRAKDGKLGRPTILLEEVEEIYRVEL